MGKNASDPRRPGFGSFCIWSDSEKAKSLPRAGFELPPVASVLHGWFFSGKGKGIEVI
jgi:hypothetical protein